MRYNGMIQKQVPLCTKIEFYFCLLKKFQYVFFFFFFFQNVEKNQRVWGKSYLTDMFIVNTLYRLSSRL